MKTKSSPSFFCVHMPQTSLCGSWIKRSKQNEHWDSFSFLSSLHHAAALHKQVDSTHCGGTQSAAALSEQLLIRCTLIQQCCSIIDKQHNCRISVAHLLASWSLGVIETVMGQMNSSSFCIMRKSILPNRHMNIPCDVKMFSFCCMNLTLMSWSMVLFPPAAFSSPTAFSHFSCSACRAGSDHIGLQSIAIKFDCNLDCQCGCHCNSTCCLLFCSFVLFHANSLSGVLTLTCPEKLTPNNKQSKNDPPGCFQQHNNHIHSHKTFVTFCCQAVQAVIQLNSSVTFSALLPVSCQLWKFAGLSKVWENATTNFWTLVWPWQCIPTGAKRPGTMGIRGTAMPLRHVGGITCCSHGQFDLCCCWLCHKNRIATASNRCRLLSSVHQGAFSLNTLQPLLHRKVHHKWLWFVISTSTIGRVGVLSCLSVETSKLCHPLTAATEAWDTSQQVCHGHCCCRGVTACARELRLFLLQNCPPKPTPRQSIHCCKFACPEGQQGTKRKAFDGSKRFATWTLHFMGLKNATKKSRLTSKSP